MKRAGSKAFAIAGLAAVWLAGACMADDVPVEKAGGVALGGAGGQAGAGAPSGTAGTSAVGGVEPGGRAGAGGDGAAAGDAAGVPAGGGDAGGAPSMAGDGRLGDACQNEQDCAAELDCVTSSGRMLAGASPGGGLCTLGCRTDDDCRNVAEGARCVSFDHEHRSSVCLEGCTTGVAGEPKCHERIDMACGLLGLIPTNRACERPEDCGPAELCSMGMEPRRCSEAVTGCLPSCGGDAACATGTFCDLASGLCVPEPPSGRPVGALCDPHAMANQCNGFCLPTSNGGDEGLCTAFCTLAPRAIGCGWDGSLPADSACLFATRLSKDVGVGDVGLCGALCDCDDDCLAADDRCVDDSGGEVLAIWGRAGYCRPLLGGESEADAIGACP